MTADTIRIDLWLWYARFFRTRSLAARAVKETRIRINRRVVTKTSQPVRVGDVLTFPKADEVQVVEVVRLGERRGPATEARSLYRDLRDAELSLAGAIAPSGGPSFASADN